jgi:hypothetical protein
VAEISWNLFDPFDLFGLFDPVDQLIGFSNFFEISHETLFVKKAPSIYEDPKSGI